MATTKLSGAYRIDRRLEALVEALTPIGSVLAVSIRSRVAVVVSLASSVLLAACGGSSKPAANALHTVTYTERSSAMEPTIRCARGSNGVGCTGAVDDRVVAEGPAPVGRFEIIAFKAPPEAVSKCGKGGTFLQRVIGLPGETLREDDRGSIWLRARGSVKFVKMKEAFISARDRLSDNAHFGLTWHVPRGSYFMMGDNRAESCDSRTWGSVPRGDVIGTVVEIIRQH